MSALIAPADLATTIQEVTDRLPFELPKFDVDGLTVDLDRLLFESEADVFEHFTAGTVTLLGDSWDLPLLGLVRQWAWAAGRPLIVEYPAVTS